MDKCNIDKFWADDITQLICSFDIIPREGTSLNKKLNAITRLALLLSILIAIFKPALAVSTFSICIVVILAIYYVQEERSESFEEDGRQGGLNMRLTELAERKPYNPQDGPLSQFTTNSFRFCRDNVALAPNDPDYISPNQLLVGGPNPKTRIPPLIAPRSHDLEQWRENDLVVHSGINSQTNFDVARSGYDCGVLPTRCSECMYIPCMCPECAQCNSKPCMCKTMRFPVIVNETKNVKSKRPVRENFNGFRGRRRRDNEDEDELPKYQEEIPIRTKPLSPLTCVESPYRDQMLTQTLQPGVYQKNHVGEPINSNIGISYTQQFVPTEVDETSDSIKYTQMNPDNVKVAAKEVEQEIGQNVFNVYDPRFTGYGTSYRTYDHKLTGQPRFFYDDINAITRPNYITRSNVDVFPWASTYGPDVSHADTYAEHRQLANNAFTDSAITFRTEMQERLMRKRNAEMWQERAMPKSTQQRLGLGSIKSCM